MATGEAQTLGLMEELLADDGPVPFGADKDTVRCQVCRTELDVSTGAPLGEVTQDNVEAARRFTQESGQAEVGGVQLDTSLDGTAG